MLGICGQVDLHIPKQAWESHVGFWGRALALLLTGCQGVARAWGVSELGRFVVWRRAVGEICWIPGAGR